MNKKIMKKSLKLHSGIKKGKIEVIPTKPISTKKDLIYAYTPGVSFPCVEILKNPENVHEYTSKSNLLAVISNGTAVLGLGNIGALASKPVMEGKSIIFKEFAGIDVFDIEINEKNPEKFVEITSSLEPTFGGINLEDIRSPDCFYIEEKLKEKMNIPIFHDDQHGTAIVVSSVILNWIKDTKRNIREVKLVISGAGAASIACADMLEKLGILHENIFMCDSKGVINTGRKDLNKIKSIYATRNENLQTLYDIIQGADAFLGCSVSKVLKKDMVQSMANRPIILALANPIPEIMPYEVEEVRSDAIVCTGRSDDPNQVNNILCFPFILRGALDVQATQINDAMKIACIKEISKLARKKVDFITYDSETSQNCSQKNYSIVPNPFDPRLIMKIAPSVAKAAMDSGLAMKPIKNFELYKKDLKKFVKNDYFFMRPIFISAQKRNRKILFTKGESKKTLLVVNNIIDMNLSNPILIGRKSVIEYKIRNLNLRIKENRDFQLIDLDQKMRYEKFWKKHLNFLKKRRILKKNNFEEENSYFSTLIGTSYLHSNQADGMICHVDDYNLSDHINIIMNIIGSSERKIVEKMDIICTSNMNFFIANFEDTKNISIQKLKKIILIILKKIKILNIFPNIVLPRPENLKNISHSDWYKKNDLFSSIKKNYPSVHFIKESLEEMDLKNLIKNEKLYPNYQHERSSDFLFITPTNKLHMIYLDLLKVVNYKEKTLGSILMETKKPVHILNKNSSIRNITDSFVYLMIEK
ncbi:phosphate acyltransferase [Candidatus Riesia pediculicola]|uniref:phosphate acyltransferase n=1 Tax=Candidatus Riesia pediculicola TaxID=401619 RepID=UPI0009C2BC18|nr:phosphate acyltransferase [Candidatus Riesia pediculicola]ARC54158.1 hypothetical protein AOE57_00815 [Candidatus Riesia pediculicola]